MKQKLAITFAALALLAAGCNAKVQNNEESSNTEQTQNTESTETQNTEVNDSKKVTLDQTLETHFSDGSDVEAVPTPEVLEIKMTADAFVPAQITINKGDYIQFTNTDSKAHWPASDPHPTHTGLAGFDSLKGIETGKYFRYQFTNAGTFSFHDHLHPALKGTVTVK